MQSKQAKAPGGQGKTLVTALCAAALMLAGAEPACALQDEDAPGVNDKRKRGSVRVIGSAGGDNRNGGSDVTVVRHVAHHKEALEDARRALADVNRRLESVGSTDERRALEAARAGLETAIESLERQRTSRIVVSSGQVDVGQVEAEALDNTLLVLTERERQLYGMRTDLQDELEAARRDIAEALGDAELELGLDGELRTIRIRSLRAAEVSLDGYEASRLEAIRQAEEKLRREREELERRLRQRQQEGQNP
jgi:hypothetical protein